MTYNPRYQISDDLLTSITEIEKLRTQIDGSRILPEREIELRHRATVEATHSSTAIEGNPLTIKQVEKVLADGTVLTRHQYAEIEVRNYKKALNFVEKRKIIRKPIQLQDILTIQGIIMDNLLPKDRVGALRMIGVDIVNQDDTKLYTAPNPRVLRQEVTALLEWLAESDTVHPVIAAAVLHYQFVSIHPFADGNGRTTRVLTQLYLGLRDYDFRGALVLDSYYFTDKQAYYRALHETQGSTYVKAAKAVLDSWVTYFTEGFLSAAKILAVEVTILSSVVNPMAVKKISRDDADLLNYARQFGGIRLTDAESVVPHVSKRTVQRKLKALVTQGYLVSSGNARNTTYHWNENNSNSTLAEREGFEPSQRLAPL